LKWKIVECNTWFKKREECTITYESGIHKSIIDYVMVREKHWKYVKNIKTIADEKFVKQHKLVLSDILVETGDPKMKRKYTPRIKIWKLRTDDKIKEF
jgi:hypothetical protein